jgi:hypothetical protein
MPTAPNSTTHSTNTIHTVGRRENIRSAVRYALRAEVIFSWTGPDGTTQGGRGWTRDISPGGAYVFSALFPPQGCSVRLNIQLPMLPGEVQVPCVEVRGRVLRLDKAGAETEPGFAVRNEKVTLCAS